MAHGAGGMQEEVRRRLAVRHHGRAEHRMFEQRQHAGDTERDVHLGDARRRGDAIGYARRDDGVDEAAHVRDRLDALGEQLRQRQVPAVGKVGAEVEAFGQQFGAHRSHAPPDEPPAAIFIGHRIAGIGQPLRQPPVAENLGVDQHPVAVEDDQPGPHQPVPVEPKPPAPRRVSPAMSFSTTDARLTAAMTSWAIRMPRVTAKSSSPRLTSSTFTSPR